MYKLPQLLGAITSVAVVLLIAQRLGVVPLLSVAGALFDVLGLLVVARWIGPDALIIRRGRTISLSGTVEMGLSLSGTLGESPEEALEEKVARHEREINDLRRDLTDLAGKRLAEIEGSFAKRLEQATEDPAIGLLLIIIGVLLSAAANIVGAYPF
jgi:hypothetical protein